MTEALGEIGLRKAARFVLATLALVPDPPGPRPTAAHPLAAAPDHPLQAYFLPTPSPVVLVRGSFVGANATIPPRRDHRGGVVRGVAGVPTRRAGVFGPAHSQEASG